MLALPTLKKACTRCRCVFAGDYPEDPADYDIVGQGAAFRVGEFVRTGQLLASDGVLRRVSVSLVGCEFVDNVAFEGSELVAWGPHSLTIEGTRFVNGTSTTSFGAIMLSFHNFGKPAHWRLDVDIAHSSFSGHRCGVNTICDSSVYGGAIAAQQGVSLNVRDTSFVDNFGYYGGAIFLDFDSYFRCFRCVFDVSRR